MNEKEKKKSEEVGNSTHRPVEKTKRMLRLCISTLALVLCLTISLGLFSPEPEKVEYIEFLTQVEEGKIEEITVSSGEGTVTYEIDGESYYTNYPYSDDFVENMLLNGVNVEVAKTNTVLITVITNLISLAGSLTVTIIMLRMLRKYLSGFLDSSSKIEPKGVSVTNAVSFADIAGLEEIKDDMRSLAELIKNKEYAEKGVIVPKGVLLDGPPGNGKTLLAKAFAKECGLNFMAINASDFGSEFVGVSSRKINSIFDRAKASAPCVVFIDEIDALGSKRLSARSGTDKEFNSILTTLLARMDGFEASEGVLVMAATNRADDLDAALLRPGRFDRKFTIGLPDKKTRKAILALYTKNIKLAEGVNFDSIASQTYGCSSAQIKAIVNEAIINSVTDGRDIVTEADFTNAIMRMMLNGVKKKTERWEGKTKDIVAYHEAGHAVVAYLLGKDVSNISIIPTTASAGGYTLLEESDNGLPHFSDYKQSIMVLYGGRAAESILLDGLENISLGASHDIKEATRIAMAYVNSVDGVDYSMFGERGTEIIATNTKRELEDIWNKVYALAKDNWDAIKIVAEELKIKESLTGDEFVALLS